MTLFVSSTANDQLSQFAMDIQSITLTDQAGKTATLSNAPHLFDEFIHLNGGVQPLMTVSVPQGTYASASVSVDSAMSDCAYYDPSSGLSGSYTASNQGSVSTTTSIPAPITITGTSMALELNLQASQSINIASFSNCYGLASSGLAPAFTPTFTLSPMALIPQPTNSANGKAFGLRGQISSLSGNGSAFIVTGGFGSGSNPPVWQVTTSGSTLFQGVSGYSRLTVGMPVDMDAAIQSDGSLAASRVNVLDTNTSNLSYFIGPLMDVNLLPPYPPDSDILIVENQGQNYAGLEGGTPFKNTSAAFQISSGITNLSQLPFTATFTASNMVPGQFVIATTHSPQYSLPVMSTVTLIPQTIDGTVTATSGSGTFTVYTVTLASYDLFPNLAQRPNMPHLITDPGTVEVYVDSSTLILSPVPAEVGTVMRFNGLIFNDNGVLRMDCAQINDGVPE
uniref:DUF5666 domain-containing protein n=1 Tax=mine drainage metagenome TaxID=410659 RepID=E6QL13_9ZZZZ